MKEIQIAIQIRAEFNALRAIGFTKKQAMQLLCRPTVAIQLPDASPELAELLTKITALANRDLADG